MGSTTRGFSRLRSSPASSGFSEIGLAILRCGRVSRRWGMRRRGLSKKRLHFRRTGAWGMAGAATATRKKSPKSASKTQKARNGAQDATAGQNSKKGGSGSASPVDAPAKPESNVLKDLF